jgi:hypothetical protein
MIRGTLRFARIRRHTSSPLILGSIRSRERLLAVGGRDDVVAVTSQVEAHHLPDVRLVVDYQDLRHDRSRLSLFHRIISRLLPWLNPRQPISSNS